MKKNIKKMCFAVIGGIMIFSAMNTAFAEDGIINLNTKVYKNINGDFSMSDTYYYSSEDKKSEKHTAVFALYSNKVKVDGKTLTIDAVPYINGGRTMLPLRAVMEIFKAFENNVSIS